VNPVNAIAVGSRAEDWLRRPRSGTVLHLSDSACHLVDVEGRLLSLVTSRHDMGPHGLLLPKGIGSLRRLLDREHRVSVTSAGLRLGSIMVRTGTAPTHDCRPDWAAVRRRPQRLLDAIPGLRGELEQRLPPGGGRLTLASELSHSLAEDDTEAAVAAASGLAGVGEGLTPAGDDSIIGVLHALWASRQELSPAATAVAEAAAALTTTLSAAWLRAAAAGEAVRPWCELLTAMAGGDPLPAARRVLSIGHSTGVHMLAGFVSGLESTLGTPNGVTNACHPEGRRPRDLGGGARALRNHPHPDPSSLTSFAPRDDRW
jgi:hypothetical protein